MLIYGYFIEILIFFCWYKLIIKKEIKQKKVLFRTFKLLVAHKKLIMKSALSLVHYSEEGKEKLKYIQNHIQTLVFALLWVIGYAILIPIFLPLLFQKVNNGIWGYLLYSIFLVALLIGKLKDETQNTIKILINYIWNVILPIEDKPGIINSYVEEINEVRLDKKQKFVLVSGVVLAVGISVGGYQFNEIIQENTLLKYISIVILLIMLGYEYMRKKKEKTDIEKSGIEFTSYDYYSIEESVRKMCRKLRIENLKCGIWEYNGINAEANIDKNGTPEINISTGFICTLMNLSKEGTNINHIFEVTVAHELAHIHYNDYKNVTKRLKVSCLLCLINMLVMMISLLLLKYSKIFMCIVLVLMIFELIFGKIMCDIRYWKQIAELKADRLGVSLCECGKDAFIEFWGRKEALENENKKIEYIDNSNVLYKFYKRYIENEAHPSIERRLELVKNRIEWNWWEYFEHVLIIHKWRISGRGWNGR